VRLDLMEAHVFSLKDHPEKPLSKPLVEFEEDRIGCEIVERGIRDVVILEGCYTTLLSNVEIRVFIDRNFCQTRRARRVRARDPSEEFLEKVLMIEHLEIATHKNLADIVVEAPPEERDIAAPDAPADLDDEQDGGK
jgi:uridine kinase